MSKTTIYMTNKAPVEITDSEWEVVAVGAVIPEDARAQLIVRRKRETNTYIVSGAYGYDDDTERVVLGAGYTLVIDNEADQAEINSTLVDEIQEVEKDLKAAILTVIDTDDQDTACKYVYLAGHRCVNDLSPEHL